ncbi:MAG: hypothetical protein EOO06_10895 [Chitinophagaceae bacterium]|nr:MAG: hypothetical protein EOO06_10895 [Chitinophagaceae bacterium]
MKFLLSILLLLLFRNSGAQSTGKPEHSAAVAPVGLVKQAIAANSDYQLTRRNPSDADAWLGYYKWVVQTRDLSANEKLLQQKAAIAQSAAYIGSTWQFSLINFIESGKRDRSLLKAALNMAADKSMIYPYAIQHAIITKDATLLHDYALALNEVNPLPAELFEYHQNVLQSAPANAIIFGKGLTDLVPMAILQTVFGIRKDIRLGYYEERPADITNTFICLSAGKEVISNYPRAGYAGLLVQLEGAQTDPELQQMAARFKLYQLLSQDHFSDIAIHLYSNYLPTFILLYKSYKQKNPMEAEKWKALALKIAGMSGKVEAVHKMLAS